MYDPLYSTSKLKKKEITHTHTHTEAIEITGPTHSSCFTKGQFLFQRLNREAVKDSSTFKKGDIRKDVAQTNT